MNIILSDVLCNDVLYNIILFAMEKKTVWVYDLFLYKYYTHTKEYRKYVRKILKKDDILDIDKDTPKEYIRSLCFYYPDAYTHSITLKEKRINRYETLGNICIRHNNLIVLQYCVDKYKYKVNEKYTNKISSIEYAVSLGNIDMVTYLFDCKAINKSIKNNSKLLHIAFINGFEDIADYLLSIGFEKDSNMTDYKVVRDENRYQKPIIVESVLNGHIELVKKHFNDSDIKSALNRYLTTCANINIDNIKMLLFLGIITINDIMMLNQFEVIKELIKQKYLTLNNIDDRGNNILHHSAINNNKKLIEYLLSIYNIDLFKCNKENKNFIDLVIEKNINISFVYTCLIKNTSIDITKIMQKYDIFYTQCQTINLDKLFENKIIKNRYDKGFLLNT